MSDTIRVGIADMNICQSPDKITTIGLGSCIGAVLYDSNTRIAGLVHIRIELLSLLPVVNHVL